MPGTVAHRLRGRRDNANHPRLRVGSTSGATRTNRRPFAWLNARTRSGSRASSPVVVNDLGPARSIGQEVCGHALAWQRQRSPSRGSSLVKKRSSTVAPSTGRTRLAAGVVLFQEEDAAGVALALLDQGLDEDAEESSDVGLAHEQIDGQLDGVALNACHALGPAAFVDFSRQGVGPGLCRSGPHELGRHRHRACRQRTRVLERSALLRLSCLRLHCAIPVSPIIRHRSRGLPRLKVVDRLRSGTLNRDTQG